MIEIVEVNLILPAKGEDKEVCTESLETSFAQCTDVSPCPCCKKPEEVCRKPANLSFDICNGKENCTLEVRSEFLEDCPGRKYDCYNKRCHSRWAEVFYRCVSEPQIELMVQPWTSKS